MSPTDTSDVRSTDTVGDAFSAHPQDLQNRSLTGCILKYRPGSARQGVAAGGPTMAYEPSGSDRRAELVDVIHRVRNRWRLKLALRGAVIVVAGTLLALFLSASSLEALRFSPTAIIAFRVIALLVFAGLVVVGFVQPLRRRVTDSPGRALPRRKGPDARSGHPERDRELSLRHGEYRSESSALAAPGREAGRSGDREVPRARERSRRSSAPA